MANEPQAPTTPESGPGTSIEKFKTPEDRDKAYLELESFSKEQARRLADLEKKLEGIDAVPAQDQRSFTDLYPAAQPQLDQRETELASRLLTRPSEVLKQHAEFVRRETLKEVQAMQVNMEAVNRFRAEHPDLAKHEEIVSIFVRKQPENLSPSERLRRAVPEVRQYLMGIAKGSNPAAPTLDPSTYVEAPTQRPGMPAAPAAPASEEDELSEFIKERATLQQKRMRV